MADLTAQQERTATALPSPSKYTVLDDMAKAVREALGRFSGTVPLAAAVGVLEIVKQQLIEEQSNAL